LAPGNARLTKQDDGMNSKRRAVLRFVLHYVEMVIAMFVGMLALDPVWSLAVPGVWDQPDAAAIVMATNMTIGMSAWMAIRRHPWLRIAEMAAAMYLPFVVLLVPYYLGAISGMAVMMGGHTLMFLTMLGAMLLRWNEYSQGHRHHKASATTA
jgi:flagellar biosynthetic protein FliP